MRRVVLLILLVVVLGGAVSPASGRVPIGYSDTWTHLEQAGLPGDLVRFPADLSSDRQYQECLAAGVTPVMSFASTGFSLQSPITPASYAERMAEAARRYPHAILQLWNEPNLGVAPMGPKAAAKYAKAAVRAIRTVDPRQRIIGPSVAPVDDYLPYLRRLYRRLDHLDIPVGLNLYPKPRNRRRQLRLAVQTASAFGPVVVTELDIAAPWHYPDVSVDKHRAAVLYLEDLGARAVILNGVRRFAPMMGGL